MLLLTLIILVILPVCANVSPGATSEAERQEERVFIYAVEKKQKECYEYEIERRIVFGAEMTPLFDI